LKTIEQATEIRRRVLSAFEEAEKESDPHKKQAWLTFSIVGGGPTGAELAGAIAELAKRTIKNEFKHIDPKKTRILLIEAGPRILAAFEESLSTTAEEELESLGVEVRTDTKVTALTADEVHTDKEVISCKTAIWAAGVAPSVLGKRFQGTHPVELDKAGRVVVEEDLSIPAYPHVFVIGDQAAFKGKDGKPLPGLAPVAMQQGRHVAQVILSRISRSKAKPFRYLDKGSLATIGRSKAVLQFGGIKISGFIAWMAWLFIHIFYLIGFKNRLLVFLQWTWSYATFSRGARLIVDKDWHLKS
jgi:NADH dehydrogenase